VLVLARSYPNSQFPTLGGLFRCDAPVQGAPVAQFADAG